MAKPPAFQFYPADWLSSPKIAVMTPAQEGAYIRLLCYCWGSGDCSIPDDDEQLAIMSRLGEGWLKGGSSLVRGCFKPHPSKAGLEAASKQSDWRLKSSVGGMKSAAKRASSKGRYKGGSSLVEPKPNSSSSSSTISEAKASSINGRSHVSLEDLGIEHIQGWLARKRAEGRFVGVDEHRVLEGFKLYCRSNGKVYKDYVAAFQGAFDWEKFQPRPGGKIGNGGSMRALRQAHQNRGFE